jgi:hypothetical protein
MVNILRASRDSARLQHIRSAQNRSTVSLSAQHAATIHANPHDFNKSDARKTISGVHHSGKPIAFFHVRELGSIFMIFQANSPRRDSCRCISRQR